MSLMFFEKERWYRQVASIPDLVIVIFVVIAVPYLNGVAVGHRSASQVDALAAVPSYTKSHFIREC